MYLSAATAAGKRNLLEALGVLSAAADGKVTDQTLMQRAVFQSPGVPKLYKSAFPLFCFSRNGKNRRLE